MESAPAPNAIIVLAHNEERRIGACLASLPLGDPDYHIYVVVNGSTDRTAACARSATAHAPNVSVHDWPEGGKSRSWNRIVLDLLPPGLDAVILVDGDAQVDAGAIGSLRAGLARHQAAHAASALPLNGRRIAYYRAKIIADHGLFGDLYALRGPFVDRMRAMGVRLPDDLVGDDGLIGALAKIDLGRLDAWSDARVQPCPDAGFRCEPVSLSDPRSWRLQYRRMINYAVRHFQDRIITHILQREGAMGLPRLLATHYADHLPGFAPRRSLVWWWFDRVALARMARSARPPMDAQTDA